MPLDEYYLGNLGLEKDSSLQAKTLRGIVLSNEPISGFSVFILSQKQLQNDTIALVNRALMAHYGSEYQGLGGDDFTLKAHLYKQFIQKFPEVPSFKFYGADCLLMAGESVEIIYPILKEGMLQGKTNANYPTAELFELVHDSPFSFDFDMLLLEKYYQPCDKETFDDWISEFKEQYQSEEQQSFLEKLEWKENRTS